QTASIRVLPCFTVRFRFSMVSRISRSASSRIDCFDIHDTLRTRSRAFYPRGSSGFDDDVAVLDKHLKGLGDIGSLLQFLTAFDRDRVGTHLEPFRVEPGLAVAHVELPAMPGAAQQFADTVAVVDSGLRRRQPRHAGRLVE